MLFATPVKSVTSWKENQTSGSNASAIEQNANSEMAMEQSAGCHDLNERSDNGETPSISAEAKEMNNIFQNVDDMDEG